MEIYQLSPKDNLTNASFEQSLGGRLPVKSHRFDPLVTPMANPFRAEVGASSQVTKSTTHPRAHHHVAPRPTTVVKQISDFPRNQINCQLSSD